MKPAFEYPVNYSTAFLSVLDVAGSIVIRNFDWSSNAINNDANRLTNDLKALENDYLKAIEELSKNKEICNGQPENS